MGKNINTDRNYNNYIFFVLSLIIISGGSTSKKCKTADRHRNRRRSVYAHEFEFTSENDFCCKIG